MIKNGTVELRFIKVSKGGSRVRKSLKIQNM